MEITPETKIKELIPDDMELDKIRDSFYKELGDSRKKHLLKIDIFLSTKEEKDFDWYYSKYINEKYTTTVIFDNVNITAATFLAKFQDQDYKVLPFEIKIGLLKFICDDLGIDILDFLQNMYGFASYVTVEQSNNGKIISKICPKDFLSSIFE